MQVGAIEFFGYKGIDLEKVRAALTVHVGDQINAGTKDLIRQSVMKAIGKRPTDIDYVCCNERGQSEVYIGLPGESYRRFEYNPNPTGSAKLPQEIVSLYNGLESETFAAVRKGGDGIQEDDSQGYALNKDPDMRKTELSMREWAVGLEADLVRALDSASTNDRRAASEVLGYANQSKEQIAALVRATNDPDDDVRNNVTRALAVMVQSDIKLPAAIPADGFIAMLNSGVWKDRNKAAGVLWGMTTARDPALLAKLRAGALDSLIEMASWSSPGHAGMPRLILGRVAGMPDAQIMPLAMASGPPTAIIEAARKE